jgi:hypothetical protein
MKMSTQHLSEAENKSGSALCLRLNATSSEKAAPTMTFLFPSALLCASVAGNHGNSRGEERETSKLSVISELFSLLPDPLLSARSLPSSSLLLLVIPTATLSSSSSPRHIHRSHLN